MNVGWSQVAVALSHAAVLEDSQRTRDKLVEQNKALQQARQEAETAIRARNDFLAVMNHEMRTPMHAIIALSSLLHEGNLSSEQRGMVDTVVKSSSLLSTLINDVLDFSRLEDGSLHLEMQPFELPTVLREAGNLAKPMAKGKGLDFLFDVAADVPTYVIGDEKRLLQTMLNVIGNAVKFTKTGSVSVVVSLERLDGFVRRDPRNPGWCPVPCDGFVYIRIVVKDTGLGVRENDIPRLFQKFVQADSTTTRRYGGTGLGLALCKKFVQLMNGHIWIESEGLGKGSVVTFIVRLQRLSSSTSEIERPIWEENLNKATLQGLKVLVTDDNSVNRIVTRRLLDRLGCNTTVVESGHQCLAALSQPGSGFKVLLLDLCMPEMDGFEVAMQIKQKVRPEDRPLVVALTANTDKGTCDRCYQIGMDGVVLKPISLAEMSNTLCNLLQNLKSSSYGPHNGSVR
jgi:ethylene receptor